MVYNLHRIFHWLINKQPYILVLSTQRGSTLFIYMNVCHYARHLYKGRSESDPYHHIHLLYLGCQLLVYLVTRVTKGYNDVHPISLQTCSLLLDRLNFIFNIGIRQKTYQV